jgi:hypothetical protein
MREILLIPEKDIKTYAATDESSYFKKKNDINKNASIY